MNLYKERLCTSFSQNDAHGFFIAYWNTYKVSDIGSTNLTKIRYLISLHSLVLKSVISVSRPLFLPWHSTIDLSFQVGILVHITDSTITGRNLSCLSLVQLLYDQIQVANSSNQILLYSHAVLDLYLMYLLRKTFMNGYIFILQPSSSSEVCTRRNKINRR